MVRPVGVQRELAVAVEHAGARPLRQSSGQRREPRRRGQERRRVSDVAEFIKDDRQLDRRRL
jgi:hypothetical protein